MRDSWRRGRHSAPVSYESVDTIADGIAIRTPIPEAVQDMVDVVDEVLPASDDHIREALEY
jgi:threonine dehydratase